MKSSAPLLLLSLVVFLTSVAAQADSIDMDDPRRALGREDDVRVDAQLVSDTVAAGVPIGVTFQIQNLTKVAIAIADKVASASYDSETRTITLVVGSEVPQENMPHVIVIAPNEKRILRASATPALNAAAMRAGLGGTPRYVQVKVSILRNLTPFQTLIDRQAQGPQRLSDELFEVWFESNDTILLNSVPVMFKNGKNGWDAENAASRGSF
jgi:hypothetical protein